jgi:hypothetical protein
MRKVLNCKSRKVTPHMPPTQGKVKLISRSPVYGDTMRIPHIPNAVNYSLLHVCPTSFDDNRDCRMALPSNVDEAFKSKSLTVLIAPILFLVGGESCPASSRSLTNAVRSSTLFIKLHCILCATSLDLSGLNFHACRLCYNVEELANQNGFRSSIASMAALSEYRQTMFPSPIHGQ